MRSNNKSGWFAAVTIAVAAAVLAGSPRTEAQDNLSYGVQLYERGDYRGAISYLSAAFSQNRNNPNIAKCLSLCYAGLHDNKTATQWNAFYESLMRSRGGGGMGVPTSQPASTTLYAASSRASGQSADYARLPEQCRVPFTRQGSLLFIDASLNNRPFKMIFDTGAESIAFGKNHLAEASIPAPTGKPVGMAMGVGSSGGVPIWGMNATIKVGTIERNSPIMVQANMPTPPLLGQEFYHDYEYTIDYSDAEKERGMIHFVKKGTRVQTASSGGSSNYSVPFKRAGKNLVVNVEVNGRPCEMYFDTGASNIAFTEDQLKRLNIQIPEDAVLEQHNGIGGSTTGHGFTVNRMRLGPIEKTNIQISALKSANMDYPLLGQSFYGDWQYTIDTGSNTIRFVRR